MRGCARANILGLSAAIFEVVGHFGGGEFAEVTKLDTVMVLGACDGSLEGRQELGHGVEDDDMVAFGVQVTNDERVLAAVVSGRADFPKFIEPHHMHRSLRDAMRETLRLVIGDATVHAVGALLLGVGIEVMMSTVHEAKVIDPGSLDALVRCAGHRGVSYLRFGRVGRERAEIGFGHLAIGGVGGYCPVNFFGAGVGCSVMS
jgi:hypothetical protein